MKRVKSLHLSGAHLIQTFKSQNQQLALRRYWTLERQAQFLSQYYDLLTHGYPPALSLRLLQSKFKVDALSPIFQACETGQALSEALQSLGFEKRTLYLLQLHEAKNALLLGLEKAHQFLAQHTTVKAEFYKKMIYPAQLFVLTGVGIGGLLVFFMPQLEQFYLSLNLTPNTQYLNAIFITLGTLFLLICGGVSGLFLTLKLSKPTHLKRLYQIYTSACCQRVTQTAFSYYYATQWLLFLNCGSSFKETLQTMSQFESIPLIKHSIDSMLRALFEGENLSDVIQSSPLFTSYFKLIVEHGLAVGNLEIALTRYQKEQFTHLNHVMNQLFKGLQFILLLAVGLIIIFIYLSILQPVFDLMQLIQ